MEFQVNTNQVILRQQDQVESGEYNVTECNFTFSSEYDGLTKKAVFTGEDGTAYLQTIVDNKCPIPSEILEVSQVVEIGVYAYDVENEELILRYSPEPTDFFIHEGSYKEAQNSTPPTPSEVEQLQAQITSNKNDIEEIQGDVVDINQDIVDIKAEQITQNDNIQTNADNIATINGQIVTINQDIDNLETTKADKSEIPTKTSDLINDSDFVSDSEYVHTDNNFTDEDEAQITTNKNDIATLQSTKADKSEIPTKTSDLTNDSGYITKNVDDLANYYKKSETYNKTEVNTLLNDKVDKEQGKGLSSNDFTDSYKNQIETNQEAISGIKDGTTIDSFGDVETALNDKEDKSNKVTELTDQSTDTQYPSAKCVYDSQEEQDTEIEALQQENAELKQDISNMAKAMYKVDGQGSDITLPNTSENKFVEFELEGRTEQEQLSGKNLLNVPSTFELNRFNEFLINLEAGSYIISLEKWATSGTNGSSVFNIDGTSYSLNNSNKSITVNLANDITRIYMYSYYDYNSSAGITATFTNLMIRKASVTDASYEPYCRTEYLAPHQVFHNK